MRLVGEITCLIVDAYLPDGALLDHRFQQTITKPLSAVVVTQCTAAVRVTNTDGLIAADELQKVALECTTADDRCRHVEDVGHDADVMWVCGQWDYQASSRTA